MAAQVSLWHSASYLSILQGTVYVLGLLLVLCFINDIPDCISSNICLYADENLLYRTINTIDYCIKLQDNFKCSPAIAVQKRRQMDFNQTKYFYIIISGYLTSKTSLIIYNYNIHNIALQETNTIKYLTIGVHIDDKLTWKSNVNTIVTKANSVKGFLLWNFNHCPPSVTARTNVIRL